MVSAAWAAVAPWHPPEGHPAARVFEHQSHGTPWLRRISCLLGGVLMASGCVQTAPQPITGYWVSSDSSGYSPVATFRVFAQRRGSGFELTVDSGMIAIPGPMGMTGPPLMDHLYLTAILAEPDSTNFAVVREGGLHRPAERRGWRPLAFSDSTPLIGALRYGERAKVPALRLTVPVVSPLPVSPLWMVFRISGNAVQIRAPVTPGGTLRRREIPGGVDVYVCGDRDVFGRLDATRAHRLKRAYGLAC